MKYIFTLLLSSLLSLACLAQHQVKGRVVDADNHEPLAGVNVVIAGTSSGTITNVDGVYSVSATKDATLVFSFVGYSSQEVAVGSQKTIDVQLHTDVETLNEIVVVGYGTQKKANVTGAAETVDLDGINSRAITNSGQILQGKVAGVQIVQNSGQPGQDDATIRIRGVSSLDNNNAPLVIIDGVQGELGDVHPNDIASMSVLKDASSAAIYGSRASAGVILIETKRGKNALRINYTGSVSLQTPTALPDVVNAATYAELLNEGRANSGYPAKYTDEEIALYRSGDDPQYSSTDWYDEYFSPAVMQNHYLNLSGGEYGQYNFSVSGGYLNQDGVLYGTDAKKLTYRVALNTYFLDKKLKVGALINGYDKDENELTSSSTTILAAAATTAPTAFFKSLDTLTGETLYGYGGRYFAMKDAGGGITRDRSNIKYQLDAQLEIIKGLKARVLYGKTSYEYHYVRLVPSVSIAGNVFDGEGSITQSSLETTDTRNTQGTLFSTLTYDRSWGDHSLMAMLGFEQQEFISTTTDASISYLLANKPVFALGDPSTRYVSGDAYEYATRSGFARINYSYKDRYLLEGNLRRDGSSRFADGHRWGSFPSVSAGWRVSDEKFMAPVTWIKDLKVRVSLGQLGNQNIGEYYASYDRLDPDENYTFGGTLVSGTGTTVLANRNVTWETSTQKDVGLEGSMLNGRFTFTLDYFHRKNEDLLLRLSLPGSLGMGSNTPPYQNVGTMINRGAEVTLGYKGAVEDIHYDISVNTAYNKSRVENIGTLDYLAHDDIVSGYSPPSGIIRSYVGEQFASYYGYVAEGIYQVDDFTWQDDSDPNIDFDDRVFVLKDGLADPEGIMADPAPGDIKFKDRDSDGEITEDDETIIGNSQPKWTFSLNFNATYKDFFFSLLAQGVANTDAYLIGSLITPFWNGTGPISQEMADHRWTPEHPSTTQQRLYSDTQRANIISSYYIQDASYLRIKNIKLGYKLPTTRFGFATDVDAQVFASVENAFTFTSFTGFDPERTYNKITGDFHPQIRIYTLGVNVQF